jgi:HK97 family phage portal protein
MGLFRRSSKGSNVPINTAFSSIVFSDSKTTIGPGGGYTWGSGPRQFVGSSRGPDTRIEVGRPGDFVEGAHVYGPEEGDKGFPYATRWPGYPARSSGWEPPFFDGGRSGGTFGPSGRFLGGGLLEGRVSTVFACTDLISRTLATMDIHVTRSSVIVPPPAWVDNPEPELYSSKVDAIQALVNSLLHRGDGLVAPTARYADGTVARWCVLNPDLVNIEAGPGGTALYDIDGVTIPRSELLHIRYQTWPGSPRGVGPLDACTRNLIGADALERWGTELALNNGIPTAILQSQVKLTKTQATDIKTSWAEAAMSRGVLPAVLSGGLTYEPLNLKPAEIGLLDLRMFDEQRIASVFGVPLWLVGLPMQDGLTYSTVDGTFDYLWRATLRPLAYNIAAALSGWALPRDQYVRFASEQLIEPPITERAQTYKILIEAGVISKEEARVMERLPVNPPSSVDAPAPSAVPLQNTMRNEGV